MQNFLQNDNHKLLAWSVANFRIVIMTFLLIWKRIYFSLKIIQKKCSEKSYVLNLVIENIGELDLTRFVQGFLIMRSELQSNIILLNRAWKARRTMSFRIIAILTLPVSKWISSVTSGNYRPETPQYYTFAKFIIPIDDYLAG